MQFLPPQISTPAFWFDQNENLQWRNDAAAGMLPAEYPQACSLREFLSCLAPDDQVAAETIECLIRDTICRQGQILALGHRWLVSAVPADPGRFLVFQSLGNCDVSPVADGEEKLLETSRSRFISSMSHELRTPLNSIAGFAEIIALKAFGEDSSGKYEDYARYIMEAASETLETVDALITLASLESDALTPVVETIDANHAIDEAINAVKHLHPNVTFNWPRSTELLHFRADSDLLYQGLTAILSELGRHSLQSRKISIEVERFQSGIVFSFSAFGQSPSTPEDIPGHAGAGIWIAATVAEAHGGGIRVTRKPNGKRKIRLIFP